jgi:hypothetical protein
VEGDGAEGGLEGRVGEHGAKFFSFRLQSLSLKFGHTTVTKTSANQVD